MTILKTVLAALIRGTVLFALMQAFIEIWTRAFPTEDADIGAGLMAFALVIGAAAVWGFFDGRQHSVLRLIGTWGGAGAVVTVGLAVVLAFEGAGFDSSVLWSDLASGLPFFVPMVAVPATIGGLLGRTLRSPATST